MNCPVADLTPLAGLRRLERLDLEGTKVTDVSPLADLTRLQYLDLTNTAVTDTSMLAHLAELRVRRYRGGIVGTG